MRLGYGLLIVCTLSSCGLFRSVNKQKESSSQKSEFKLNKDSTGVTIDKSKTTIKELVDTTIRVSEKQVRQQTSLSRDSLVKGMTAIKSDLVDVQLILDPLTGVLTTLATIKEQYIPVKLQKETTTENDIRTESKTNQATSEKSQSKQATSKVQREPVKMGAWVVGFCVLALVVLVIGWLRKRNK